MMSTKYLILLMVLVLLLAVLGQKYSTPHPDTFLNITELIKKHGYPVETHEITTEDGYIIDLFRILHGKNDSKANERALLIVGGSGAQAEHFIISATMNNSALAYYFADHDYDVWLGNVRGTQHGTRHIKLSANDPEFWKFSWHEMGVYDLPSMVDYILERTGRKKIFYIGQSQAGTMFYVLNSLKPEYQEKFAQASLLAPSGYLKHQNNFILRIAASLNKFAERIIRFFSTYKFALFPINRSYSVSFCAGIGRRLCEIIYKICFGNSGETDLRVIPIMIQYTSNVSWFQALHYGQVADSGHFRQWDYGLTENLKIYGTPEPPDYPVENIQTPIAIFYSIADHLSPFQDILEQCEVMPGCRKTYRMPNPKWTHMDFIFAKYLSRELGEPLLQYMDTFDDSRVSEY